MEVRHDDNLEPQQQDTKPQTEFDNGKKTLKKTFKEDAVDLQEL